MLITQKKVVKHEDSDNWMVGALPIMFSDALFMLHLNCMD